MGAPGAATAFFISLGITAFSTGVSFLLNRNNGSKNRLDATQTSLRPDEPLPWIIGRQAVGGIIFEQTDANLEGKKAAFWVALGEGPLCTIYDMLVNNLNVGELGLGRQDEDGLQLETQRHPFEFWNGDIDGNSEPRDNLGALNENDKQLAGGLMTRPGHSVQEFPGTSYFGIFMWGSPTSGGIPQFRVMVEGLLLPKIPDATNTIMTFVSAHNKWITWKETTLDVYYSADILDYVEFAIGGTQEDMVLTRDDSNNAIEVSVTLEVLCVAIAAVMTAVSLSDLPHAQFNVFAGEASPTTYNVKRPVRIESDEPFILTTKTGGHYGDSIFEDLGFYTHRDEGVWDFGEHSSSTNPWTAPFGYNVPFFLTGVKENPTNFQHTLVPQSSDNFPFVEFEFDGGYSYVAQFKFNRTFSDNPVRAKYFFETFIFNKTVDNASFVLAERKQSRIVENFYDAVELQSQEITLEFPVIEGEQAGHAEYHSSVPSNQGPILVALKKNAIGLAFDGRANTYGILAGWAGTYMTVDMKSERSIIGVEITQNFNYCLKVEYATDDGIIGPWTVLKDFTDGSGGYDDQEGGTGLKEHLDAPVTARWIRFSEFVVDPEDAEALREFSKDIIKGSLIPDVVVRGGFFTDLWVASKIRIMQGFPARYARCDVTINKSLQRKEIHSMLNQAYAMFDYQIDGKMAVGVYKAEDPDGLVTDESIIPNTFNIEDISSDMLFNQVLISYFDVHDAFISHPLIINDVEDQNLRRRNSEGTNTNVIIHGPRQYMDGHVRRQQADRYVESSLLAQRVAPFKIEFEATRDARAWEVGKVYEIQHAYFNADGVKSYRLGSATDGFKARLRRKVQYFDNRFLTVWEAHNDNVFLPNPRRYTEVPVQADRQQFSRISEPPSVNVSVAFDSLAVDPSSLIFRLTWPDPAYSANMTGCVMAFKIRTPTVNDTEDDPWRALPRSQGRNYAVIKTSDLRLQETGESINLQVNSAIKFRLKSINAFGVQSPLAIETEEVTIGPDLFRPHAVSGLRLVNSIEGNPGVYIDNEARIEWAGGHPQGKNFGPKNRGGIASKNVTLKDSGFDYYKIDIRFQLDDGSYVSIASTHLADRALNLSAVGNQSIWDTYLRTLDADNPLQDLVGPRKKLRIGVSVVNTLGVESIPVWIDIEHKGDFRKASLISNASIYGEADTIYSSQECTVLSNGDILFTGNEQLNTAPFTQKAVFIYTMTSAVTVKVVLDTVGGSDLAFTAFQSANNDLHFIWRVGNTVKYAKYDDSYSEVIAPVTIMFGVHGIIEGMDSQPIDDSSFLLGITTTDTIPERKQLYIHPYTFGDPPVALESSTVDFPVKSGDHYLRKVHASRDRFGIINFVVSEWNIVSFDGRRVFLARYDPINKIVIGGFSIVSETNDVSDIAFAINDVEAGSDDLMFILRLQDEERVYAVDEYYITETRHFLLRSIKLSGLSLSSANLHALGYGPSANTINLSSLDGETTSSEFGNMKLLTINLNPDQF